VTERTSQVKGRQRLNIHTASLQVKLKRMAAPLFRTKHDKDIVSLTRRTFLFFQLTERKGNLNKQVLESRFVNNN
jgi:hypothetical protein